MAKKKAQRRQAAQSGAPLAVAARSQNPAAHRTVASATSLKALARHLLGSGSGFPPTAASPLGPKGGGGSKAIATAHPVPLDRAARSVPTAAPPPSTAAPPSFAAISTKAGAGGVKKTRRKRKSRKNTLAVDEAATGSSQPGANRSRAAAAAQSPARADGRCFVSRTTTGGVGSLKNGTLAAETSEEHRELLTSTDNRTDDKQPDGGASSSSRPSLDGHCTELGQSYWIRDGKLIRIAFAHGSARGAGGACRGSDSSQSEHERRVDEVLLSIHETVFPLALQGACQLRHVSGPALRLHGYTLLPGDGSAWHDVYSPRPYPRLVVNVAGSRRPPNADGKRESTPAAAVDVDDSDDRWVTVAVKLSPKADALVRGCELVYGRLLELPALPDQPNDCRPAALLVRMGGACGVAAASVPELCLLDATARESEPLVEPPAALLESLEALDATATLPVVLICGGKNAGKSTLTRYVVNNLLNKYEHVFYLDVDPGQTEFTPSGCIALKKVSKPIFGPPWTHVGDDDVSVRFLGCLSPASDPDGYMECLRSLVAEYAVHRARGMPLIVNTMGWVTGLGLELLISTLHAVRPSLVVQISSSSSANKNLPAVVPGELPPPPLFGRSTSDAQPIEEDDVLNFVNCHLWSQEMGCASSSGHDTSVSESQPARSSSAQLGAPQCRDLMTLSYFCQPRSPCVRRAADPVAFINAAPPFAVPWDAVVAQLCGGTAVADRHVLGALNASVVVLATVDQLPSKAQDASSEEPTVRIIGPDIPTSYVGFGLVRAIDVDRRLLYITTPVSRERLAKVNCIRRGAGIELPEVVFTTQAVLAGRALPYVDVRRQGVGARSSQSTPRNFKIAGSINRR